MEKIIHSFIENNKKELEIKDKLLQEKTVFCDKNFNNINNLVYDEIDKSEFIYILSTDIDGVYKIGKSNSIPNRKNTLQTACDKNINILFQYTTFNKTILENVIHYVFDYYRCKSNREHFRINLHYAINIIKMSGLFLDTLKSTYENITFDEIIEKINNKLDTLQDSLLDASQDNKLDDDILNNNVILLKNTNSSSSAVEDNIDTPIKKSSSTTVTKLSVLTACDIITWFKDNYNLTDDEKDVLKIKDVYERFTNSYNFEHMTKADKRKYNKTYFVNFFESNTFFSTYYCNKSQYLRTFLKFWKLKKIE